MTTTTLPAGHVLGDDGYVYDQDDQVVAAECQDCGCLHGIESGCDHGQPLCDECAVESCRDCAIEQALAYEEDRAMRSYGEHRWDR